MLNNILNYIEKNKMIFSVIAFFLFIVLIITYKNKYNNSNIYENNDNFDNISPDVTPLNIDSLTMPNINSTNMLLTTISFNDQKGNIINNHYILGIYKLFDCVNLKSEDHSPECTNNIPILIPYDTYIIMKTKYLFDKNMININCQKSCTENCKCPEVNVESSINCKKLCAENCKCPKINLQYIVDFQINKGTLPNRYFISGKQRDTVDASNNLIIGNKFLLSNNLYNHKENNELYRHLCFDNTQNKTDETEIIFEPSDEPLKYYIVFTKSINDKITKFYVGQTDIDIHNTCYTGIFKFKRLALQLNKEQALKFVLI